MTREEAIEYLHKLFMQAEITDEYGDMDDTEPYETAIDMAVEALQEQKKGKWIRHPIYPGSDHYYYACSECDYRSWSQDNYCSVCGAKMEA